jgi:hypothetical protein
MISVINAQEYKWVINPKGTDSDYSNDIFVDDSGNSFTTGYFRSGSLDCGNTTLYNSGGIDSAGGPCFDLFVIKMDSNGVIGWAKSAGQTGKFESATGIAGDHAGNVFISGWFTGTNFQMGGSTLVSAGLWEGFLAKYDNTGNVSWAQKFGGPSDDVGTSVAVDDSGNVYFTGYFFSPTIQFGTITLTKSGGGMSSDAFLAKFDNNGNVKWAKKIGGSGSDLGRHLAVDKAYNVYLAGNFAGSMNISGTPLSSSGNTDIFLAKYTSGGAFIWAKKAGGSAMDHVSGIAVYDTLGCAITGEAYSNPITFGTIPVAHSGMTNTFDSYVARYDQNGTVLWAKGAGGADDDIGRDVTFDTQGNLYACGDYASATFGFGGATITNSNANGTFTDFYVAKFDSAGTQQWLKTADGFYFEYAYAIGADAKDNLYFTGPWEGNTLSFSPQEVASTGNTDFYIAKIGYPADTTDTSGSVINEYQKNESLVFPNPNNGNFTVSNIDFNNEMIISVFDITGRIVYERLIPAGILPKAELSLNDIQQGLYMLRVVSGGNEFFSKFVVRR